MKFYNASYSDVLNKLNTTADGLSSKEAEVRLERDGKNKLAEAKKVTLLRRFLNQIKDPMLIVLIIAAGISFAVTISTGICQPASRSVSIKVKPSI